MENETKKEIDLIDALTNLGIGIWNMLKKCLKGIGWTLRLIYQEKFIILACMIIGAFLGVYLSRVKVYRAEVEMKINAHDSYFYKNMIDPLFNQCKYRDDNSIAKDFGITLNQAKKIANIQSFFYVDVLSDGTPDYIDYKGIYNASDTMDIIMPDRLRIVVDCQDTSMFSNMEDLFAYFFSQNPQIVKENNLRKRQLDEKIAATTNEIVMLDSLRKREYFVRKRDVQLSTDKMVVVEREMKLYHNEILALENQKQQLVWERDVFEDGVSFSSHFEPNPHPVNGSLKLAMIFTIVFLFIGVGVASLKVNRKRIVAFLQREV